jgi:hypothetical protein
VSEAIVRISGANPEILMKRVASRVQIESPLIQVAQISGGEMARERFER